MIMVLAGNYMEAKRWAEGQLLEPQEWTYPIDENDIMRYKNFHVVVVGSAGMNVPSSYFERILSLAKQRGRLK